MSKLLINEYPLQVLPTLAKAIGLNEAMMLQQIHYWISNPKVGKKHEGRRWIYNSVREWREEQFPFWSEATITRTLKSLKDEGLVLSANLNRKTYDRTLWYTIDYRQVRKLQESILADCTNGNTQNDKMDTGILQEPIPESTQESTQEIISDGRDEFYSLQAAVADVTRKNVLLLSQDDNRTIERLVMAGYTAEDIRAVYGGGGWWHEFDWRGQKGQVPTIKQIVDTIGQAMPEPNEVKGPEFYYVPVEKEDGTIVMRQVVKK